MFVDFMSYCPLSIHIPIGFSFSLMFKLFNMLILLIEIVASNDTCSFTIYCFTLQQFDLDHIYTNQFFTCFSN